MKNAGVKNIPDTIVKVKVNEPKVVQFLAEKSIINLKPQAVEGFFGPFEVFQPEMDILKIAGVTNIPNTIAFKENPGSGSPLPDLRAFPAIPESARKPRM